MSPRMEKYQLSLILWVCCISYRQILVHQSKAACCGRQRVVHARLRAPGFIQFNNDIAFISWLYMLYCVNILFLKILVDYFKIKNLGAFDVFH